MGKSTFAERMQKKRHMSVLPLDAVRVAIGAVVPELDIVDGNWDAKIERFFPALQKLLSCLDSHATDYDYLLEGDCFLPQHVVDLQKRINVKAVFLGVPQMTVEHLKEHIGKNDWLLQMSEEKQAGMPAWIVEKSKMFQEECAKHNLPYVETGPDFEQGIARAEQALFGQGI